MNKPATILQLDIFESRANRDSGMKVAEDHANAVTENWSEIIYGAFLEFLKDQFTVFMAEDFRGYCAYHDYPLPPHSRAFGSIIVRAAKSGLIKRVAYGQVSNVKAHRANASVWQKN